MIGVYWRAPYDCHVSKGEIFVWPKCSKVGLGHLSKSKCLEGVWVGFGDFRHEVHFLCTLGLISSINSKRIRRPLRPCTNSTNRPQHVLGAANCCPYPGFQSRTAWVSASIPSAEMWLPYRKIQTHLVASRKHVDFIMKIFWKSQICWGYGRFGVTYIIKSLEATLNTL